MPDPRNLVTLTLEGTEYQGWTDISIVRGIEQVAGGFSVGEAWPGTASGKRMLPGYACTVRIDGDVVITGYVDIVEISYDDTWHTISAQGRDAAGDLVDCSVVGASEWRDLALDKLVGAIARPFGIPVKAETDVGAPFAIFRAEEGETAWSAIERACRMRAVLCISDGAGGILLTRAGGAGKMAGRLESGARGCILAATGRYTDADRHSTYVLKAQNRGTPTGSEPEQAAHVLTEVADTGVQRYRPLVILAEDIADRARLDQRARWEESIRRGKAREINVTVPGWRDEAGRIWTPNALVQIKCDWLRVDAELLITQVRMVQAEQRGTITELTLADPSTFDVSPEDSRQASGVSGIGSPVPRP